MIADLATLRAADVPAPEYGGRVLVAMGPKTYEITKGRDYRKTYYAARGGTLRGYRTADSLAAIRKVIKEDAAK